MAAAEPVLHFSQTWEDPRTDARGLAIRPGDTVVSITAAGCTPLHLLAEAPGRLISVDVNPAQSHLLELKAVAMRHLDAGGFAALFDGGAAFLRTYRLLRGELGAEARGFWDRHLVLLEVGSAGAGAATRFIHQVGHGLRERLFRGAPLGDLFRLDSLAAQREFFDRHLRRRWIGLAARVLDPVVSRRLALRAVLPGDYFPYATVSGVLSQLWRSFEHTVCRVPAADNYFLARLLLGMRAAAEVAGPDLYRPEVYAAVGGRLDRLEILTGPLEEHLDRWPAGSVDAFQLSNIFEWMRPDRLAGVLASLRRVARPGARLVFRDLFTRHPVPETPADGWTVDEPLSRQLAAADRSILYPRCWAATACG